MTRNDLKSGWQVYSGDVMTDVVAWRDQPPQATFQEIESAIDDRLARLRAHMLEDAALASAVADLRDTPEMERPPCPLCGTRVQHRTRAERTLLTQHGQTVTLERSYAVCPQCGEAFFPPR